MMCHSLWHNQAAAKLISFPLHIFQGLTKPRGKVFTVDIILFGKGGVS